MIGKVWVDTNLIMSEFFLELFSEEIPPKLQTNARKKLFLDILKIFLKKIILK